MFRKRGSDLEGMIMSGIYCPDVGQSKLFSWVKACDVFRTGLTLKNVSDILFQKSLQAARDNKRLKKISG